RAGRADARVALPLRGDEVPPSRLDVRQLELLAEDLRELLERDLDLEDVLARLLAAAVAPLSLVDGVPDVAVPLPHAFLLVRSVAEVRDLDLGERDADEVLPLPADHLAAVDVLPEILLDLPADDLLEPVRVLLDFADHEMELPPSCREAGAR